MTGGYSLAISPRVRASFDLEPSALENQRAQGMPGARCARSRAWWVVNTRVSHHGRAEIARHSPRNGFNGFLRALLGDRACLPPSLAEILPAKLDASVGASGPHDFAVRVRAIRQRRSPRPPHPALNVRDDRETPLCEAGRGEFVKVICPTKKAEYFSPKDWTTQITLIRLNKSPVSRRPPSFDGNKQTGAHAERLFTAGAERVTRL
jgi:hypothetical protein